MEVSGQLHAVTVVTMGNVPMTRISRETNGPRDGLVAVEKRKIGSITIFMKLSPF
jgi:hypothetical protein